ncbi:ABC transporter [Rhodomicrobium udaipurense JA643]|uniref:Branched-chain amino acid ABC transporter substrate-binding protein n=1 Tax=Rhodomicrobium udaipurense TaxID=1202716 RepID=A0A8I1KID9_9HYPH|nr:branched-chain amino acid ABC transporter substrate-binding protein [Rhodomicrobium udaipurense]KAI95204.1 ABC transporter [Rhodomicrobium udaipurense JA643]MBJ7542532.1 branched-chain amino acid ABC transporter substrate-binding protein [Rhodomicrobium udaipurense]
MRAILAGLTLLGLGAAAPAWADDISIAIAGPMTGKEATFGAQFKAGGEAAVADINAKGGVLGKQLKLEMGDDQCDPKQARAVAEQLSSSGVAFVAGHFCSSSSIPASSVYNEQGIVQISPGSTNPKLTDERPGDFTYRMCGRDDQQGGVAGAYLAKEFADKKIAILHDKTAYGQGLADETKKALNAAGKQEVFYEAITPGEKDYTAVVTKLKQNGVDVVYLGGYHTEAGLIIRQMRAQGMKTILVGGDALVSTELGSIAGDDVEGTMMTFSPDPRKNPAAKEVVEALEKKGINPEGYVVYTYAAVQTWAQAAEKAGSIEGDKVVVAMKDLEFDTALGKFKFDAKGDPNLPSYVFYRWGKKNYEQIQ